MTPLRNCSVLFHYASLLVSEKFSFLPFYFLNSSSRFLNPHWTRLSATLAQEAMVALATSCSKISKKLPPNSLKVA